MTVVIKRSSIVADADGGLRAAVLDQVCAQVVEPKVGGSGLG